MQKAVFSWGNSILPFEYPNEIRMIFKAYMFRYLKDGKVCAAQKFSGLFQTIVV